MLGYPQLEKLHADRFLGLGQLYRIPLYLQTCQWHQSKSRGIQKVGLGSTLIIRMITWYYKPHYAWCQLLYCTQVHTSYCNNPNNQLVASTTCWKWMIQCDLFGQLLVVSTTLAVDSFHQHPPCGWTMFLLVILLIKPQVQYIFETIRFTGMFVTNLSQICYFQIQWSTKVVVSWF